MHKSLNFSPSPMPRRQASPMLNPQFRHEYPRFGEAYDLFIHPFLTCLHVCMKSSSRAAIFSDIAYISKHASLVSARVPWYTLTALRMTSKLNGCPFSRFASSNLSSSYQIRLLSNHMRKGRDGYRSSYASFSVIQIQLLVLSWRDTQLVWRLNFRCTENRKYRCVVVMIQVDKIEEQLCRAGHYSALPFYLSQTPPPAPSRSSQSLQRV